MNNNMYILFLPCRQILLQPPIPPIFRWERWGVVSFLKSQLMSRRAGVQTQAGQQDSVLYFFFNCTGSSFGLRTFSSCGMWEAPLGTVPRLFSLWSMGSRMYEPSSCRVKPLQWRCMGSGAWRARLFTAIGCAMKCKWLGDDGRLLFNSSPQPGPCSLRARGLWPQPKCLPRRHSQWLSKRLLTCAALWLELLCLSRKQSPLCTLAKWPVEWQAGSRCILQVTGPPEVPEGPCGFRAQAKRKISVGWALTLCRALSQASYLTELFKCCANSTREVMLFFPLADGKTEALRSWVSLEPRRRDDSQHERSEAVSKG